MSNSYNRVMAFTPLPKLVPIGSPRFTATENITKNMITDVLQSEPVKRLLSQPNIVIKAISLTPSNQPPIQSSAINNSSNVNIIQNRNKSDDSVTLSNSHLDDEANFLPSKNDGKSEVALLPIKRERKQCGHYEACENIVCDVNFQQYVDYDGSSPILAFNIDESEINAPVSRHCDDLNCDALSIDHNRCRRAVIRLCRYDKSNICDICGISLKTRKARFNHKNCKRKHIYQHNDVDSAQILRERMRIKELQMMAALRMKKNNYCDPLTADDKAIEILKNNSELIVIPKTVTKMPTNQPSPSILTVNTILNQNNQNINDSFGSYILPKQTMSIALQSSNNAISLKPNQQQLLQQKDVKKLDDKELNKNLLLKPMKVELTNGGNVKPLDSQFIVTGVPQATITYPLTMNDWVIAHTAGTPILPTQKPYLMPVRVVPIANLKSEPSLLHQTQGIPKFCIIADNSAQPQSYINLQTLSTVPIQSLPITTSSSPATISTPIISTSSTVTQSTKITTQNSTETDKSVKCEKKIIISSPSNSLKSPRLRGHYNSRNQRQIEKKLFICTYCSKRFLTEWYFKMHIARHIGEVKATCEICEKTFTHHYDLTRHINIEHKDKAKSLEKNENEREMLDNDIEVMRNDEMDLSIICDNCENVFDSNVDMKMHKCKKIINNEAKNGGIVIIDSIKSKCNDEIKKENGIARGKVGETLSKMKLRKIVRSQKKIVKKRVRKRKNKSNKRFKTGNSEVSHNDNTFKC